MNLYIRVIENAQYGNKHTITYYRDIDVVEAHRIWLAEIEKHLPNCCVERKPTFFLGENNNESGVIRITQPSTYESRFQKLTSRVEKLEEWTRDFELATDNPAPGLTRHEISIPTCSVTAASKIIEAIGHNAMCTQARVEHVNERLCYAKVTVWI